ncbi:UvrD-helicase domain-containing protein [Streptomyces aidingensis]|uniref:DNA 3'-5' helicase n=1 Tax=Streptomyces aidingensis TaxID=910347 RepID=A0A1I1TZI6_9ACTN|nr:UvrD-helicase domain-containing protein [Streptomyces aidingensis]SFD62768.1 UvrD-like helicase C-terminal domain-containing protein [Streptomyces aidingensis]
MSDPYRDAPPLTDQQRAVAEQPWDAWTLVTAGAGAGKTHTLVRRLDHLVAREELEEREILVLSFSRAAVRELRNRIDRHASAARRIRAQTFDSWATSLLAAAYPDGDWRHKSFDGRIADAGEAIERGAVEAQEHGAPAHLVVDEVQDLIGPRREMVETLIDRFHADCGFTLVGDPAQSIYGFQVADPEQRAEETNWFFDWLRRTFGEDLEEFRLDRNFRARTEEARAALRFGSRLRTLPSVPEKAAREAERIHTELRSELLKAPLLGALDDPFVCQALTRFPGTCAILCRDNGIALRLSELLCAGDVPHRLQRSAEDRPAPSWIAALLRATDAANLSEDVFHELYPALGAPKGADPDRLWLSLRRAAGRSRSVIDTDRLRRAVAEGRLPDELTAPEPASLVVSTVHRAKGLEFDRVVVVEPEPLRVRTVSGDAGRPAVDYDPPGEARLLFVSMTRPRDDLYRLAAPPTWFLHRHRRTDRWYVGGREAYVRKGMAAGGLDIDRETPASADGSAADAIAAQEHLAQRVHIGDELILRLRHRLPLRDDETPPYDVFHEGRIIGSVSERFRRDLHALLKINRSWEVRNWPSEIVGFRADGVEAVCGSVAAGTRAGLGRHGVWLAPRLSGLGRFRWQSDEESPGGDHD